MDDLKNQRVVVRDSTGSSTEGTYDGEEIGSDGITFVRLLESRQINYVDTTQDNACEFWSIEGVNRIAKHLIAGIHLSHLPPMPASSKKPARARR